MSKKKGSRKPKRPVVPPSPATASVPAAAPNASPAAAHTAPAAPAAPAARSYVDWRRVRLVGLLAAAYIFLLCMTTQSVVKWTAMVLMVAAIAVGLIREKVLRVRITWVSLFLLLWVVVQGISTLYAAAGKFAIQEYVKILVGFCLAILILAYERGDKRTLGRSTATLVECFSAFVSLISIDLISTRILSSLFLCLTGIFSDDFKYVVGIEEGVRMTSILDNPNIFAGCVGIGVLLSLGLANSAKNVYERRFHTVCLALSALGFLLAFSMGASGVIAVTFLIYLFLEPAGKRSSLLILMVETLVCTLAAAFPIYLTSFGAWTQTQPVPLLAAICSAAALCLVDRFVGQRVSPWLAEHSKAALVLLVGVLAVCAAYAALALNVTGGITLESGESLRRSAYPESGSYTLAVQADQDLQVVIESQNQQDTMMHTSTTIYRGSAAGAEFTVPEDSIVVYFNFSAAQETRFDAASYQGDNGEGSLKLGYKLLPGFIANRMQGLFANQNAIQRVVFFEDGLKLFQRSPILGLGLGGVENSLFSVQTFNYVTKYIHNHYIQTLAENGVIGLILFVGLLLTSLIAVWKKRRSGEESPLNNTLGAVLIFMAGHAAVEVVFSSSFYLPMACSIFALISLCSADTMPVLQTKEKVCRWIPRVTSILLTAYAVLLAGNLYANKLFENPTYESLEQAVAFDRFEWQDYMTSYVYSAASDPESRTAARTETMERYMQRLEEVDSNILPLYLSESYFNLGNTEKAFEMLDKYLNYVASDQKAWDQAFQLVLLHASDTPEFKDGVLQVYSRFTAWNEENIGTLQISPEFSALVDSILAERSVTP